MPRSQCSLLAGLLLLLSSVPSATAGNIINPEEGLTAVVLDLATYNGSTGLWDYRYGIRNGPGSEYVIDGLIFPFFDEECVALDCPTDYSVPTDWTASFVERTGLPDPWSADLSDVYVPGAPDGAFVDPPYVLIFSTLTNPVRPGETQGGFGFSSPYGPAYGPILLVAGGPAIVDPLMPRSPNFPASEPVTLGLFGLGLLGLGLRRRAG